MSSLQFQDIAPPGTTPFDPNALCAPGTYENELTEDQKQEKGN